MSAPGKDQKAVGIYDQKVARMYVGSHMIHTIMAGAACFQYDDEEQEFRDVNEPSESRVSVLSTERFAQLVSNALDHSLRVQTADNWTIYAPGQWPPLEFHTATMQQHQL